MLRTIINDLLSTEPDLVVVGCSAEHEDPLARALEENADMLITQNCGARTSSLDAIIAGPLRNIVAIAPDGRNAAAVGLVRRVVKLDGDSKATFADAIRSVAADV